MSRARLIRPLCLPLLLVLGGAARAAGPAPPTTILKALKAELERSVARLRIKGYEAPYFVSYTLRDLESYEVGGKFGAVVGRSHDRRRIVHVEVRVGSHELDNSSVSGHDAQLDEGVLNLQEVSADAPLDDDIDALRGVLWQLTDQKYKQALAGYARKRARRVNSVEDESVPSFSREPPARHIDPLAALAFDGAAAEATVRRVSARFKQAPLINGDIKVAADSQIRYYVSSEGSEIVEQRVLHSLGLAAQGRARDGMMLVSERDFYGRAQRDLPTEAELIAHAERMVADLRLLQQAPVADPYTGPAILMEEAAGVFFHETIGHRLEGERQSNEQEGRTFKGQVGQRVIPEILSIIDDPTLMRGGEGGPWLNGFYRFDDEGVAARRVVLIERGTLRDYLKSRTPIPGSLRSNGHGRAEGTSDPIGRMGNLIVHSTRQVKMAELKALLLAEVRRQGKPFGLVIRDILGGSTNTASFGSQTFRGQPTMVYRVDARTGEETLVRGVEMVGTPLSSVAKIIATSDTSGVFNGYCGAESGMVPVSTMAPAVLFTEIELQRSQRPNERPPILPPPWQDAPTQGRASPRAAGPGP